MSQSINVVTARHYRKLTKEQKTQILLDRFSSSDAVVIGAGAGLSTAAGFTYSGERFERYFPDFEAAFGITDMYSGGFYPFPDEETMWAWWSRAIYVNRYVPTPGDAYANLYDIVKNRNYFVITTNVDHQFQKAGFDKRRLFYTQGDYGLLQSTNPVNKRTYDNEQIVRSMLEAQGFIEDDNGILVPPADGTMKMRIPSSLVPVCPDDGAPMTLNLRVDENFAEDEGWHEAQHRYHAFLDEYAHGKVLYLELGVGMNTPSIIKIPFWTATAENPQAFFATINLGEAMCPRDIANRALCVDDDIADVLRSLKNALNAGV